jgi:uncharacterized protein YjiS (DUF1127 family)
MIGSIQHAFRTLGAAFSEWRERERAMSELAALDDRTLADIGIRRTDIPFVLAQANDAEAAERAPLAAAEVGPAANRNDAAPRRVA